MDFAGITKLLKQGFTEKGKMPVEILVNGGWLERQMAARFILRKEGENPIETLTKIPTHIDNSVDTFKFVYSEE
jgi:hypothetical protein